MAQNTCGQPIDLDLESAQPAIQPHTIPTHGNGFVVIGDTQTTSYIECIMGREVNHNHTIQMMHDIAIRQPAFLVHLGDLVFNGSKQNHWQRFDSIIEPLNQRTIPIFPVLGNHEYWGNNIQADRNVVHRFPILQDQTWYAHQYQQLGLIWLNSNRTELSRHEWSQQLDWLDTTVTAFDAQDDIKALVVFTHHAPFTNSPVVNPNLHVRRDFVGRFCESKKAGVMMTGHAHGYERFSGDVHATCDERVIFMITAGGGGPRPDSPSTSQRHAEQFTQPWPRPLNFVEIAHTQTQITLTVHGITHNTRQTEIIDVVTLDL